MARELANRKALAKQKGQIRIVGTSFVVGSVMFVFFVFLLFQILGMNEYY